MSSRPCEGPILGSARRPAHTALRRPQPSGRHSLLRVLHQESNCFSGNVLGLGLAAVSLVYFSQLYHSAKQA